MLEFVTPEPWIVLAPVLGIVWLSWLALNHQTIRG
jgi:hypothetical protein